jgi:transposase
LIGCERYLGFMKTNLAWDLGPGVSILGAERIDGRWIILARQEELGSCPACGKRSTSRHGWHERHLRDLPAQGADVTVKLRMRRWRCRNKACQCERLWNNCLRLPRRRRIERGELRNSFIFSVIALGAGRASA